MVKCNGLIICEPCSYPPIQHVVSAFYKCAQFHKRYLDEAANQKDKVEKFLELQMINFPCPLYAQRDFNI